MNQPAEIDLQPELHRFLVEWAQQHPEIEQIVLFGSRALGNAKKGSDVDLAVVGTQVAQSLVDKFHTTLEEDTLFPYFFEVVHLDTIQNPALREQIQTHGHIIYNILASASEPSYDKSLESGSKTNFSDLQK